MTRDDLLTAIQDHNVLAFLRVIREGESSQNEDAYNVMFGGDHFESFADHPRRPHTRGKWTSTAAGAYQFLARTWDGLVKQYGFGDFSPVNQDLGAIALIAERTALDLVKEGRIREAINRCAPVWASLPGSQYGQPTQKLETALKVFEAYGGKIATTAAPLSHPPQEVKPMAPALLLPLLELAGKFIPVIAEKFSSGSEVAQRNVAAGKALGEAIVEATQAVNLQEAVTKLESDPEARAAANAVVADLWPSLFETGGGGVTEARKMVFSPDQLPPWRNAAVWITAAFVPLIYAAAYAVLYREGASDDLKTMVVTAIFAGLLGSITGFFLGSSLGSQKKDQAMGRQA